MKRPAALEVINSENPSLGKQYSLRATQLQPKINKVGVDIYGLNQRLRDYRFFWFLLILVVFYSINPTPRRSIKQLRAFDGWRCIVLVCIIATCRMQLSRLNQTLIESQLIKLPSQILLRGNPISLNGFFTRSYAEKKTQTWEESLFLLLTL